MSTLRGTLRAHVDRGSVTGAVALVSRGDRVELEAVGQATADGPPMIARVSGSPLPDFLAERLFEPLGMVDTGFFVPAERLDRFTGYYRPGRQSRARRRP